MGDEGGEIRISGEDPLWGPEKLCPRGRSSQTGLTPIGGEGDPGKQENAPPRTMLCPPILHSECPVCHSASAPAQWGSPQVRSQYVLHEPQLNPRSA